MPVELSIVYFGTAEFAVAPLLALLADKERFVVTAVVTQPDRQGNRGKVARSPVAKVADAHGIPVLQPESLKDPESGSGADEQIVMTLSELQADLFVVAAYGLIVPQAVLDVPTYGALNLHGSILPKLRGASPIQTAILDGLEETGVTLMQMDAKMDHGPAIAEVRVPITPTDDSPSLTAKLSDAAAKELVPKIHAFCSGELLPTEQDHDAATFCRMITKEDGRIDWSQDAARIERMTRAYRPWPGAYTEWQREGAEPLRLKVLAAAVREGGNGMPPGTVTVADDGMPVVATGNGLLALLKVLPAGKKEMDGSAFVNGFPQVVGKRFA